jgi:hypothetical protein
MDSQPCSLQHGVSLAYPSRITEENLQLAKLSRNLFSLSQRGLGAPAERSRDRVPPSGWTLNVVIY